MYFEISQETKKYLDVQIYGHKGDESLKKFNRIDLTTNDIENIQILQNSFYFGDQSGALERLGKLAIRSTLAKLEDCCSLVEINFVYFLHMLVDTDGEIDISKYEELEKMYNTMFGTQQANCA